MLVLPAIEGPFRWCSPARAEPCAGRYPATASHPLPLPTMLVPQQNRLLRVPILLGLRLARAIAEHPWTDFWVDALLERRRCCHVPKVEEAHPEMRKPRPPQFSLELVSLHPHSEAPR